MLLVSGHYHWEQCRLHEGCNWAHDDEGRAINHRLQRQRRSSDEGIIDGWTRLDSRGGVVIAHCAVKHGRNTVAASSLKATIKLNRPSKIKTALTESTFFIILFANALVFGILPCILHYNVLPRASRDPVFGQRSAVSGRKNLVVSL